MIFSTVVEYFLALFLATREAVAPLANDPIMSDTSKHQNMSIRDDSIHSSGIIYLVPFLATEEALAPLVNVPIMLERLIWLLRHLECQNLSIILDSVA